MKNRAFVLLLGFIFSQTACVSMQKYKELELVKDHYKAEYENYKNVAEENQKLQEELNSCNKQLKQCYQEAEELSVQVEKLSRERNELQQEYNNLLEQNKALLASASYETQSLQELLTAKEEELDRKERELADALSELENRQSNLSQLQKSLQEREKKVKELEALLAAKDEQVRQMRAQIEEALLGFSSSDFTITERDGKLYLSLSQGLLFKKGSDKLDYKGLNAIKQIAEALNTNPDMDITVEGHTDSDGSPERNWDLSVLRAATVVKALTQNGVDPHRISACGRAFYSPVAPNDTEANKALNRRTEIILTPQLDQLYKILDQ